MYKYESCKKNKGTKNTMFCLATGKYGEFSSEHNFVWIQNGLIFYIFYNFILLIFVKIFFTLFNYFKGNFKITKYFFLFKFLFTYQLNKIIWRMFLNYFYHMKNVTLNLWDCHLKYIHWILKGDIFLFVSYTNMCVYMYAYIWYIR